MAIPVFRGFEAFALLLEADTIGPCWNKIISLLHLAEHSVLAWASPVFWRLWSLRLAFGSRYHRPCQNAFLKFNLVSLLLRNKNLPRNIHERIIQERERCTNILIYQNKNKPLFEESYRIWPAYHLVASTFACFVLSGFWLSNPEGLISVFCCVWFFYIKPEGFHFDPIFVFLLVCIFF